MAAHMLLVFLTVPSLFLAVSNAAPTEGAVMDWEKIMSECNEQFPIKEEYLKALNETGSFPEETDKTPKCYVRCMLMKIDLMDEAGNFDVPKIKAAYKESKLPDTDKMIDTCVEQDTETKCMCTKAYLLTKCLMTQHGSKFERLQEGESEQDDGDGNSFKDMMTNFFREAGGVVLTVLTILSQFREIIASALDG